METRTQNFVLIATLVTLDAVMIALGWFFAYELRVAGNVLPYFYTANPYDYLKVVLVALPLWIVIFALCRLYNREELLGGPQEYGNVVKGCVIGFAALIGVSVYMRTPDLARGWLAIGLILVTLLVGSARFLARRIFYSFRQRGWFVQRALIVGTNDDARAIARQLSPFGRTGVQVVGFVDDYLPVNTPIVENLRVVAATPNLHSISQAQKIDQVILVSGAMTWESFDELLRGITLPSRDTYAIKVSPGMYETLTTGVRVSYKNRVPLLEIERAPITGIDRLLKGALDYGVAVPSLILLLPFMALIAATLFLLGRRPVIEPLVVLGKNGQAFNTYRFAALRFDTRETWSRGTRFGRFLYASGLEKMPQLWNVLRGKMSLVGPRPIERSQLAQMESWLPNLFALKPGMTGARASSPLNVITLEQEMRLELYYARNYSIWLDLQILFQTFVRVLKRERIARLPQTETAPPHAAWHTTIVSPQQ